MRNFFLLILPILLVVGCGKSWEEEYEKWIKNPQPYGGLDVLQQIKDAKESGATTLSLTNKNISDLTPLAGLTNLTELILYRNNIGDLTPLAESTNLTELHLSYNKISDISPLAGLTNLTDLGLKDNNISTSQIAILQEGLPALRYSNIYW